MVDLEYITSREMNRLDNNTESLGIPKSLLMELAGSRTADFAFAYYNLKSGDIVSIVCGTGNNGGDGLVAARHLASKGILVHAWLVSDKMATDISQQNLGCLKQMTESIKIHSINMFGLEKFKDSISKSVLIIDALLGTGISGQLRDPIRLLINTINEISTISKKPILAIDIPSGMDPDTGKVEDIAVLADSIITIHKKKPALKDYPSINSLMELQKISDKRKNLTFVADIGIPPEADIYCGLGDLKNCLKKRKKDAAKGQYGKLLIIGGSKDYSGAPALAALAASQIGVDLIMIVTPEKIISVVRSYSPNFIVKEVSGDSFSPNHIKIVLDAINWADAVLIGPGLSRIQEVRLFLKDLIGHSEIFQKSIVFDADALSIIAEESLLPKLNPCLLTPHRGEMTKLLQGKPATEENIQKTASIFGGCILAKGPTDLIVTPQKIYKNRTGCPEMSVGGTGDILAGLCVAFLCLKNSFEESACAAAYLNGKIGEQYVTTISPLISSVKLIEEIPKLFSLLK